MSEKRMKLIRRIYRNDPDAYDEMAGKHPSGGYKNGYTFLKKLNKESRKKQ